MNFRTYIILLAALLFAACKGTTTIANNNQIEAATKKTRDSIKHQKEIDRQMSLADMPDDEELPPSQTEERKRLESTYNKTQIIETELPIDQQNYHLVLMYYCLRNDTLIVPETYDIENKPRRKWVTHPFATKILLLNKTDTLLNKRFTASDFYPFFKDPFGGNLKKAGSILMPELSKRNKDKIVLNCSISIPATDIGIGMYLIIEPDGKYRITQNLN